MTEVVVSSNLAKEGDSIIVYEDIKNSRILKLTSTGHFDTKFGRFFHKDIIGKEFGSKISAKNGYVYILRPSPSLITQSLPHRTQILYSADISVIILKLGLKPGSIVVESGTGSGSLSSSLATAVGPKGFLYTFEFNQDRAEKAQVEFNNLGFKNIKVTWRDACGDGFLPKENDTYQLKDADAVFLDLPRPWDAIGHASAVLRKGGRICCFSPCIEQVQKTCLELKAQGYVEVRTFECISRSYERKKNPYKSLGHGAPASNKRRGKEELEHETPIVKKEKLEGSTVENVVNPPEEQKEVVAEVQPTEPAQPVETKENVQKTQPQNKALEKPKTEFYFTSGSQFIQGHTGYLTFATKL